MYSTGNRNSSTYTRVKYVQDRGLRANNARVKFYTNYYTHLKVASTSFLARGTGYSCVTRERNVRKKREINYT